MGVIYLAEDTRLGRKVALKVLRQSLAADPGLIDRLTHEARACAMLQHPNVVRILSLEQIERHIVIEMDYIEGGSLLDCLLMRPVPVPRVVAIAYQVLSALIHCHERGIVHRDIKPSNILLDADGRAYLTDFGIAKAIAGEADLSVLSTASSVLFVGSPRYAPPESWESNDPTPQWDIYSLGVTIYEAVSGKALFDGPTPLAIVKQLVSKPALRLREVAPHVSDALGDLIDSMINPDPSKRPQTAVETLERLKTVPEFSANELETPTIVPMSSRKVRRIHRQFGPRRKSAGLWSRVSRPAIWAVSAGLLILVVALASYFANSPPAAAPAPLDQRQAINAGVVDPRRLFEYPKHSASNGQCRVYDVYLHDRHVGVPAAWMQQALQDSDDIVLVALPRAVWSLRQTETDDGTLRFDGQWGEYQDDAARLFRHGTIRGTGIWISPNQSMTATLEFQCGEDGETRSSTLTVTATAPPVSDARFLASFEGAPLLPSLLYNEMLPRQLGLAQIYEQALPAVVDQVARSPRFPGTDSLLQVDGRLEEGIWRQRFFDDSGRIGTLWGFPGPANASIRFVHSSQGLYLGVDVPASPAATPKLDLCLLTRYLVPSHESARWRVSFQEGQQLAANKLVNQREVPWACAWEIGSTREDGRWTACVFIPFENVEVTGVPTAQDRWRLNCTVVDMSHPDNPRPLAWWGFPDVSQVQHGAVVAFSPNAQVQGPTEGIARK